MIECSNDRELKNGETRPKIGNSWRVVQLVQFFFALVISIPVILLFTSSYSKTWDQKPIYIASDAAILKKTDSVSKKEGGREALLEKLGKEEVLFTAEEFASRITSYYNTLVVVLGSMVAFFTIASFFLVNNFFKNEFEREKLRIIKELDSDMIERVRTLLRDSIKVRKAITGSIRGEIENDFVRSDYIDGVISSIEDRLKDIGLQLTTLQELCPSRLSVVDDESSECNDSKGDVWE